MQHGAVMQSVSGVVPEKSIKMDNRAQLFGTCSALVFHCCTPSRPVMKTVSSFIVGFPRICITISSTHVHATTFHQEGELPFPAALFSHHCTSCTPHRKRGKTPSDKSSLFLYTLPLCALIKKEILGREKHQVASQLRL